MNKFLKSLFKVSEKAKKNDEEREALDERNHKIRIEYLELKEREMDLNSRIKHFSNTTDLRAEIFEVERELTDRKIKLELLDARINDKEQVIRSLNERANTFSNILEEKEKLGEYKIERIVEKYRAIIEEKSATISHLKDMNEILVAKLTEINIKDVKLNIDYKPESQK